MRTNGRAAREARQLLREKVRAARDEKIPFTEIARAAGYSREAVRKVYEGK